MNKSKNIKNPILITVVVTILAVCLTAIAWLVVPRILYILDDQYSSVEVRLVSGQLEITDVDKVIENRVKPDHRNHPLLQIIPTDESRDCDIQLKINGKVKSIGSLRDGQKTEFLKSGDNVIRICNVEKVIQLP